MVRIPSSVRRFARSFADSGHELYLVGGAVRDLFLGKRVEDFDFATDALPDTVRSIFRRVIPTGIRHGTVTVLFEGNSFEVTTYRSDGDYSDSRRPDTVSFAPSIREDLARRDFTMNAIALDPRSMDVVDPYQGREAISQGRIVAVGDAAIRFAEDALRMVRAVRFAAQLRFDLDTATQAAILPLAERILAVAPERLNREYAKIMESERPSVAWRLMRETGLLPVVAPELDVEDDLFEHLLATCDCVPAGNAPLRWAALLHDVGKPECARIVDGRMTFHDHDRVSARRAEEFLDRYRFSKAERERIVHLVRNHMFGYSPEWSDAAVRRFLHRLGRDAVEDVIALRIADACGKGATLRMTENLRSLKNRVDEVLGQGQPLTVSDLAITGTDLMTEIGLSPGPRIGILLHQLLETCLDDPTQNERGRLLAIAGAFARETWGGSAE